MPAAPHVWRLQIRIQPRAARTRIVGRHGSAIKVQVHAPPVEGAANAALVDLLATSLAVSRSNVRIVQGLRSRDKLVEVHVDNVAACRDRLDQILQARVDKAPPHD